jgi:hypothetical protein
MSELPPADVVRDALRDVVAPVVGVAAMVFGGAALLAWLAARVREFRWRAVTPIAAAVAVAAAVVSGNEARGVFEWKPDSWYKWWHWVYPAVGLAVAVEVVARLPGVGVGVGHLLRGAAAGVIAATVVPAGWTEQPADRWWVPAVALALAAQWAVVDAVARRVPGWSVAAAVAAAAWGAATVLMHNKSHGFADLAVMLLAALGVLAGLARVTRTDAGPAGAAAVVPLMIMLLVGRETASEPQVPKSAFLLAGFAPSAVGLFLLPGLSRWRQRRWAGVVLVGLVLIPAAVAGYLAMDAAPLQFGTEEEAWE